jgi:hypothetical protein
MLNIRFIRSFGSYSRTFHFAKRQRDCHDPTTVSCEEGAAEAVSHSKQGIGLEKEIV